MELELVCISMEKQMAKIQESKRITAAREAQINSELQSKGKTLAKGAKQYKNIRQEIDDMWVELD